MELEAEGYTVQMVTVNKGDAVSSQQKLLDRCAFPQLQDTEDEATWELMGGGKDDFYIYNRDGELTHFFPFKGAVETNLSKEEGYTNLKNALLEVLESSP